MRKYPKREQNRHYWLFASIEWAFRSDLFGEGASRAPLKQLANVKSAKGARSKDFADNFTARVLYYVTKED
jgi:hypothetical protein